MKAVLPGIRRKSEARSARTHRQRPCGGMRCAFPPYAFGREAEAELAEVAVSHARFFRELLNRLKWLAFWWNNRGDNRRGTAGNSGRIEEKMGIIRLTYHGPS